MSTNYSQGRKEERRKEKERKRGKKETGKKKENLISQKKRKI